MSYPLPRTVRSKRYRFRSAQERRQDRARRFGKVGFHVGPLEPVATARRRRTALFGDPRAVEMVSHGHRDGTVVVTARFGQVEACGLRDQPTGQACGPSRAESARARDCWGSPCDARHIGGCAHTWGGSDGGYRSAPPATEGRRQASLPRAVPRWARRLSRQSMPDVRRWKTTRPRPRQSVSMALGCRMGLGGSGGMDDRPSAWSSGTEPVRPTRTVGRPRVSPAVARRASFHERW